MRSESEPTEMEPYGTGAKLLLHSLPHNLGTVGLILALKLLERTRLTEAKLTTGGTMEIMLPETVSYFLKLGGDFEPDVTRGMLAVLRPGDCLWNIGAHIGTRVVQAASKIGSNGIVYAFEPTNRTRTLLETNATRRTSTTKVDPRALSNSNGGCVLLDYGWIFSGCNKIGCNSSPPVSRYFRVPKPVVENVSCATIDQVVVGNYYRPPDVMVIDVEGHEEQVFSGGIQTIRRFKPAIIFEVGHETNPAGAVKVLRQENYIFFTLHPRDQLPFKLHTPQNNYMQGNLMAVHPQNARRLSEYSLFN